MSLFNINMTSDEALSVYCKAVVDKTESEILSIEKEYSSIFPVILKREFHDNSYTLTSRQFVQ